MHELSGVSVTQTRVAAPRPPESPAPYRFPLLAALAPVLASVIIWQVTGSAFALIFAAIGPITALASLLDARLGSRRTLRRELRRFRLDASDVAEQIELHHSAERDRRRARFPTGSDLALWGGGDPHRWSFEGAAPLLVNLGIGSSCSAVSLDMPGAGSNLSREVQARLTELESLTQRIQSGPLLADARLGIGISGVTTVSLAAARSVVLQLARTLSPADFELSISAPSTEREWLAHLPHVADSRFDRGAVVAQFVRSQDREVVATVATAASIASLPSSCRIALLIASTSTDTPESNRTVKTNTVQLVHHPDPQFSGPLELALVSREQAVQWALGAREIAIRDGLIARVARLPDRVELSAVIGPARVVAELAESELAESKLAGAFSNAVARAVDGNTQSSLCATFVVDEAGPVTIDLVSDGPHAVVGGTTGSGKSELLISWVVSLASAHPPESVTFLLVDFKGGAAFASLKSLPHTVGIITDLDEAEAARALSSLRAELRFRERTLASAGARDIGEVSGLARLVIVVDEFATVIDQHPDLHALFSDIAARGRSLGVHLVLCTQRPGVTVRDAVLANTDLRISLRVNNRTDSVAVVGSEAAARLDPTNRGRAILAMAGHEPGEVQVAVTKDADVREVVRLWAASTSPRRPWCEALPKVILQNDVDLLSVYQDAESSLVREDGERCDEEAGWIPFGLLDQPERQRRAVARYEARRDGNLLIIGRPGSGKSTMLGVLGTGAGSRHLARSADAAWDEVSQLAVRLERSRDCDRGSPGRELILIDDIDSLLLRFSSDHRTEFVARLSQVLRDGSAAGLAVAMAAQRLSTDVHPLAALAGTTMSLAPATRQELSLLGLDPAHFVAGLPPGGGIWRGDRVQVVFAPLRQASERIGAIADIRKDRPLAVVSGHPSATVRLLDAQVFSVVPLGSTDTDPRELVVSEGRGQIALIGDAEQWQSRWGALASLRPLSDILFHRCTVLEVRTLTRSRELPPVLGDDPALCWRWRDDGGFDRVRLEKHAQRSQR